MWKFKRKRITNVEQFPEGTYGFVYKITNKTNGKIYVGKKNLFTKRKKRFGKRKIAQMEDKRAKKWEYIEKESDWLSYTGSCVPLNEDVANGHEIIKEILQLAKSKAELTYLEAKWQFCQEVIEKESYNDSILGKFYRKIFEHE